MILNLDEFFKKLDEQMELNNLSLKDDWFIDHICYRTSSEENYQKIISEYQKENELLIESLVGGRLIATFKLKDPIIYKGREIPLIEIPAPKSGRDTKEGWEHIEIVIKESFEKFQSHYSHIKFLTHALKKEINPELEIEMDSCSIKFHHQSLEEVIEYEKTLD